MIADSFFKFIIW